MNDSQSIDAIFCHAIELDDPQARDSYVAKACGQDVDLQKQVQRLLYAHFRGGSAIDAPDHLLGATLHKRTTELIGVEIGPYKLLQEIGEGGMGTVYMAEQSTPVQRRVALKIIKPGMDTRQVIARFEAERQALAMMDHPHIAKVLDAGSTDSGRPYFVMELVRGTPITQYCDERQLTLRQRLELFLPVCQAIQHAHQKGVIHRDIKPSNVLIAPYDGKPVVKVIDFGVAKATGRQLTDKTLFTEFGAVLGTLEYMSPEQAELNNQDIDTRSDIYALGVLLYELLTGSTPLTRDRLKLAGFSEMLRIIREEEPPRPSIRLSTAKATLPTVSQQRKSEPAQLTRTVRGELDWIVMKALDKDRNQRYETANGFATDVQRYLDDEPVQACPPSVAYWLRKFARRNKAALATAAIVLAALVIGTAVSTWQAIRASQANQVAQANEVKALAAARAEKTARESEAEQRKEATGNLYDSLVREARAARLARRPGYRELAWHRLRQARDLNTPKRNLDELRQEAALCLGDFVGLEPTCFRDLGDSVITTIASHPRAPLLAVGFESGTISLHRLQDGSVTSRWMAHPNAAIVSLAFNHDGTSLASVALDRKIVLSQPDGEGTWASTRTLDEPLASPRVTVVSTPDGKQLAACSRNGIQFWRTEDGQPLDTLETHDRLLGRLALSPDGKKLAADCEVEGEVALLVWDVATRKVIQVITPNLGQIFNLAFSKDGKLLACACHRGMAVFETSTGQRQFSTVMGCITALAFTPDGQWLAYGGQFGGTKLLDLTTNREEVTLDHPFTPDERNPSWVYASALSSDGKTIVSASQKAVVLWNIAGADERRMLKQFAGGIPGVAFSPRGDLLASVCNDRSVTLWDPPTGRLVRSLEGCQGPVQAVTFSPDGRLLATGDWSGKESVRIWDVETGESVLALAPALDDVWSVAFSLDGHSFAAGGGRGWVVWKIEGGLAERRGSELRLEVDTRRSTSSTVGCLTFTCDDRVLAWVERDRLIHLWNRAESREQPSQPPKVARFFGTICRDCIAPPEQGSRLWLELSHGREIWDMKTEQRVGPAVFPPEVAVMPDNPTTWGWWSSVSPDHKWWAVGHGHGTLLLWDLSKIRARLEEAGFGWETGP